MTLISCMFSLFLKVCAENGPSLPLVGSVYFQTAERQKSTFYFLSHGDGLFCFRVNNCVGFSNYKYFILFLTYTAMYCLVICATSTQYFIKFWTVSISTTSFFTFNLHELKFVCLNIAVLKIGCLGFKNYVHALFKN